jgi:hypothetical protein
VGGHIVYKIVIGIDYPLPVVKGQQCAKITKQKVAEVRNGAQTKAMANQVYQKHGSRNPQREEMNGRKPKPLSNTVEREDPSKQPKTTSIFQEQAQREVAPGRSKSAINDRAICMLEERTEQKHAKQGRIEFEQAAVVCWKQSDSK